MHQPLMHFFVWLHVRGDVVFSVGPVLLTAFLLRLLRGAPPARRGVAEPTDTAALPAE
jgi:nitric oxide reductase large subunit